MVSVIRRSIKATVASWPFIIHVVHHSLLEIFGRVKLTINSKIQSKYFFSRENCDDKNAAIKSLLQFMPRFHTSRAIMYLNSKPLELFQTDVCLSICLLPWPLSGTPGTMSRVFCTFSQTLINAGYIFPICTKYILNSRIYEIICTNKTTLPYRKRPIFSSFSNPFQSLPSSLFEGFNPSF